MTEAASTRIRPAAMSGATAVREETLSFPSASGDAQVHVRLWMPESIEPRGIVQIVHGMAEHIGRYAPFARRLAEAGYVAAGHDHLGHGATVPPERHGVLPARDGADILIDDVHTLRGLLDERHPGLPHVIFGHSMGSFVTRCELGRAGAGLDGAIICGTGQVPAVATGAGRVLARAITAVAGDAHRSALLHHLALGGGSRRIKEPQTPVDWISASVENVDAYLADDLCGFTFSAGGFSSLFALTLEACSSGAFKGIPSTLPLLFIAGAEDPISSYGAGVRKAAGRARDAGVSDVTCTIYPAMRHEILNEAAGAAVMEDVLAWLEEHVDGQRADA